MIKQKINNYFYSNKKSNYKTKYKYLGTFSVTHKEIKRSKRNNSPFLIIYAKKNSTTFTICRFNNPENYNNILKINDRILIKGYYDNYDKFNNNPKIIATVIKKEFNVINYYIKKLQFLVAKEIKNIELKNLIEKLLNDNNFMQKFISAPASLYNHHAYRGGLLIHTVKSMELGIQIAKKYSKFIKINKDILLTGLFLHDLGKIFSYTNNISLTIFEKYIGHQLSGILFLLYFLIKNKISLKTELLLNLINIILTHHTHISSNNYRIKPISNEAKIVNMIDSLDALIGNLQKSNSNLNLSLPEFKNPLSLFEKVFKIPN